jgi:hypothetical protein
MLRKRFLSATILLLLLAAQFPVSALTFDQQVTPEYLKAHPKDWSLKVEKRDDGMAHFTLRRTLPDRKYVVARLVVKQEGKKVAEVSTPSFGIKGENRFYVALSPAQLAEAEYSLSESFLAGPLTEPAPIPGTVIYTFSLKDFVK